MENRKALLVCKLVYNFNLKYDPGIIISPMTKYGKRDGLFHLLANIRKSSGLPGHILELSLQICKFSITFCLISTIYDYMDWNVLIDTFTM